MKTFFIFFVVVFFIFLAGYFSACETAITSVSRARFHQLAKEGDPRAVIIRNLQKQLGLVISVLLMCTTMIHTVVTTLMTAFIGPSFSLVTGLFLLLYGEVMPKMLALVNSDHLLLKSAPILDFVFKLFRPFNQVINFIARQTLRVLGLKSPSIESQYTTEEELKGVIDLHKGPGQDVQQERAMLKSILDLDSVQVGEIMVHRKDVSMIHAKDPISSMVKYVLSSPYTRFPVWKDHLENIVGVIHSKALLRAVHSYEGNLEDLDVLTIASPPWFVPESIDLLHQLQAFRRRREHFSIVVDEYGSLQGIVTLEDVLEEIVGEIDDEHDVRARGVRIQSDGSCIVHGDVTIRDLNRQFEWELSDVHAATVAGLLLHELRFIPEIGQVFIVHGFRFEVLRRHRHQVTLVKISPLKGKS